MLRCHADRQSCSRRNPLQRPILVERGSFRATNLTLDLLDRAQEQFLEEPGVVGQSR